MIKAFKFIVQQNVPDQVILNLSTSVANMSIYDQYSHNIKVQKYSKF